MQRSFVFSLVASTFVFASAANAQLTPASADDSALALNKDSTSYVQTPFLLPAEQQQSVRAGTGLALPESSSMTAAARPLALAGNHPTATPLLAGNVSERITPFATAPAEIPIAAAVQETIANPPVAPADDFPRATHNDSGRAPQANTSLLGLLGGSALVLVLGVMLFAAWRRSTSPSF